MMPAESYPAFRSPQFIILCAILKQEGLIGEIRFGTDAARYDRKLMRHDHALCNKCGKLVDIELSIPIALFEEASALSKYDAESIELTLRGLCPDCCK